MTTFISKLIGKRKTASELVELLAGTEAQLSEAESRRSDLVDRRHKLLLEGSDAEVDQLDCEIAEARRKCDRLVAAIGVIEERIEVAREREREDYLDRLTAFGEKLVERALAGYHEYEHQAQRLADLAMMDSAIDRRLTDVNQLLAEVGRPKVRQPEYRATKRQDGNAGPGLSRKLKLPNPADAFDPLYPIGQPEIRNELWSAATARLDREVGTIPAAPAPIAEPDDIGEAA